MEVDSVSVVRRAELGGTHAKKDLITLKQWMINRLARSDAHFRHQTRDEPDLKTEEKCDIANELLEKSAGLFLERFSKYLALEDIACFSDSTDDYRVAFYINEIKEANKGANKNVVKNRRYQALQEMVDEGEYFSEAKMQSRDPLLFEQLVGRFETEEEKQAKDIDKSDLRLSSILMKYMDKQEVKYRYEFMKDREEMQEEEEDEDTEEEEEEEEEDKQSEEKEDDDGNPKASATNEERSEMRDEFLRIMQERFLSGEDSQFDYSQVDSNAQYDSMDILNQEAEERYFDDEDSNSKG